MAEKPQGAKNGDRDIDPRAAHTHAPRMFTATLPADVLFTILLLAFLLDAGWGDPPWLYRRVPHPVALLGRAIELAELRWNNGSAPFLRGLSLVLVMLALAGGLGWAVERLCAAFPGGWILEAVLASSLIAYRGLHDHVRAVAEALDLGLDEARAAVAHIVGRDPGSLDEAGVARAAIESAAENFSDAVVAPVFWGLLLGLPGIAVYKAINTLDSMIGHRTPRHLYFGRAAARLDDVLNWVPARLSGILFCIAASLTRCADARQAWVSMLRDARKHRSPNAGWPEAAVAGALGIRLAGPRHYANGRVDDAWIGVGGDPECDADTHDVTAVDVHRALRLCLIAGAELTALLAIVVVVQAQM
jgi:adenosylcobinamide-phosphate synthase